MTIAEIVKRFMERNHYRLVQGTDNNIAPLTPFFIMDAGYQYYCKFIKGLELAQEAQLYRNKWYKAWKAFNSRLTTCFNADEREEVYDLMEDCQAFIQHDMELTWINGTNCFCDVFSLEEQKVLAAIMMANQLAVDAQSLWRTMHCGKDNGDINGVLAWSKKTAEYYMGSKGVLECKVSGKKVEQLQKCEKALVLKILRWIETINDKVSNN